MNAHHLRAIILKLQDRLSDDDRKRLHFFFGQDVPRRIRDDPSLGGTLSLMECLFDQDKINEENFTFLIHAFEAIQCVDAAKLLREHMRQIQPNEIKQSMRSLAEIMPITIKQLLDDQQDDKYGTQRCEFSLPDSNIYDNNKVMTNSNDADISPTTAIIDNQTTPPLQLKRKQIFSTTLILWICLCLFFVMLIILLGAISRIYIRRELQNNLQLKENILAERKKCNETIQRLNGKLKYGHGVRNIPWIAVDARWSSNGVTVAGGNGKGNATNQLNHPSDLFVDGDQTVVIADFDNHRIIQWKKGDANGQIIAGGNGEGNRLDQLDHPSSVLIDKETDSVIICDRLNRRVVRWSRRSNATTGEILLNKVHCRVLAMDDQKHLYVSDTEKYEVRRYQLGDQSGMLVAGGNGQGNGTNQFQWPTHLFVDRQQNVYVSDNSNHRIMKWNKGAKEGIIVAGDQSEGNTLTQSNYPEGILVDALGTIYVADSWNHRVMRWPQGSKQGTMIVGENDSGAGANRLNSPRGLFFDEHGNLYVVDCYNNRIQRFSIE
ncbi:unnamed protein product [Rotaria socialis]|uniref:DED domain-containing protein n=1 Tax=Rotaria socialis TaxID=392032 RepID=A0A818EI16_9BILA|nr:unnamed protein product [Rotaria socialis]CAF4311736.1 unnamed protein product [Rotaria socialis]